MSSTELDLATSVCEKCGMGLHFDEEGKVACDGCRKPTDRCACQQAT